MAIRLNFPILIFPSDAAWIKAGIGLRAEMGGEVPAGIEYKVAQGRRPAGVMKGLIAQPMQIAPEP